MYRSRLDGIEQHTTGALHGMGSNPPLLFCQKERHPVGVAFFWYCFDTIDVGADGGRWRDLIYIFLPSGGEKLWCGRRQDRRYSCTSILAFRLQSYGPQPESEGFSHGLKKCPPDTFLPSLRSGRPFKSPSPISKESPPRKGGLSLLLLVYTLDIIFRSLKTINKPSKYQTFRSQVST